MNDKELKLEDLESVNGGISFGDYIPGNRTEISKEQLPTYISKRIYCAKINPATYGWTMYGPLTMINGNRFTMNIIAEKEGRGYPWRNASKQIEKDINSFEFYISDTEPNVLSR